MIRLLSINVSLALPLQVPQYGLDVVSGINKRPVSGPVQLNKLGLVGDEQADLSAHGGLDKAVYAYPSEHFPFWQQRRGQALKRWPPAQAGATPPAPAHTGTPASSADTGPPPLLAGAMGENLTMLGLLERDVWVGDRLQIGAALLEVTEPRQPCFKFNAHMGFNQAVRLMVQTMSTGFYLRVLETAAISCDDAVTLLPGRREVPLMQINELRRKFPRQD